MKRGRLKKGIAVMFAVFLTVAALSGCGEEKWTGEDATATTIGLNSDGTVLEIVVEDFSKGYYSRDELKKMIESDIEAFNAKKGGGEDEKTPIVLNDITQTGNVIKTSITYSTTQMYSDFTMEQLFYGTLRQARLRGFELPSLLFSVNGGRYTVSDSDTDRHVVFSDGRDRVTAPGRIIAYSEGVALVSENEADLSNAKGRSALLFEK